MASQHLPNKGLVLCTLGIALFASSWMAMSKPTALSVDGRRIVSDVPPVVSIAAGREAYVPIRAVGVGLGAETSFDPKSGWIEVVHGGDMLRMKVGDKHATLNGQPMTLKHAPFVVRGRAMVALSTVSRALGSSVRYDKRRAKIDVSTPGVVEAGAQDAGQ